MPVPPLRPWYTSPNSFSPVSGTGTVRWVGPAQSGEWDRHSPEWQFWQNLQIIIPGIFLVEYGVILFVIIKKVIVLF